MDSATAVGEVLVVPLPASAPGRAPLTDDEIRRMVAIEAARGIRTVRFDGDALRRRGIVDLVAAVREVDAGAARMRVVLSTDGVRLPAMVRALAGAGLAGLVVHLDTLRRDRFAALTGEDRLGDVLDGLRAAGRLRFETLEMRSRIRRGVNEDEVRDLVEFAWSIGADPVLEPQLPVAASEIWSRRRVVDRAEVESLVAAAFGLGEHPTPDGLVSVGERRLRIAAPPAPASLGFPGAAC